MTYQDRWDGTETVTTGYRECADRYRIIAEVLTAVSKPFTVLDVGAAEGYFAARIADEFGVQVTAIEPRVTLKRHRSQRIRWINQTVRPQDLDAMDTFDVVLALSLLHHIADWRTMLPALQRTARHSLIVETPHPQEALKIAVARHELGLIDTAVRELGGVRIGTSSGVWDRTLQRGIYRIAGYATEER